MIALPIKSMVIVLIISLIPLGYFAIAPNYNEISESITAYEELEIVSEEDCELSNYTMNLTETIECYELAELLESGKDFYLIDVRDIEEWNTGYIKGAILIPYKQILDDLAKLPEDKSTPIVLYCKMGSRSASAMNSLKDAGYTNVTNLIQGIMGWTFEGYPLEIPSE